MPNLIPEEKNRVVLIFVEREEEPYYSILIKDSTNRFLALLPTGWRGLGCRVVRQVMKSVIEVLHPGLYFQMDDDVVGAYKIDDKGEKEREISISDIMKILEEKKCTAVMCCQPNRNIRFSKRHWKIYKHQIANTWSAEKLVLFDPNFTKNVHYAPPVVFDWIERIREGRIEENLRNAIRQGEDFGFCHQIGMSSCSMLRAYYLKEQCTPSRNQTKKLKQSRAHHQLLINYDQNHWGAPP